MIGLLAKFPLRETLGGVAAGIGIGAALCILGGAAHFSLVTTAGLCTSGGVLAVGSMAAGALKVHLYFKQKSVSEPLPIISVSEPIYVPSCDNLREWEAIAKANPEMVVAGGSTRNKDVPGSITMNTYNMFNRGINDGNL